MSNWDKYISISGRRGFELSICTTYLSRLSREFPPSPLHCSKKAYLKINYILSNPFGANRLNLIGWRIMIKVFCQERGKGTPTTFGFWQCHLLDKSSSLKRNPVVCLCTFTKWRQFTKPYNCRDESDVSAQKALLLLLLYCCSCVVMTLRITISKGGDLIRRRDLGLLEWGCDQLLKHGSWRDTYYLYGGCLLFDNCPFLSRLVTILLSFPS